MPVVPPPAFKVDWFQWLSGTGLVVLGGMIKWAYGWVAARVKASRELELGQQEIALKREEWQDALAKELRAELRADLQRVESRVAAVQAEHEAHALTKALNVQLTARIGTLQDKFDNLQSRYVRLEQQVRALEEHSNPESAN
jgi:rhamnose utilization protein RhaD (predicted bifunctional aldolase and dehydrogenase)